MMSDAYSNDCVLFYFFISSWAAVSTKQPLAVSAPRSRVTLNISHTTSPGAEHFLSHEENATLRKDVEGVLRASGIDLVESSNAGSVPLLHIRINISRDEQEGTFLVSIQASLDKKTTVAVFAGATRHRDRIFSRLRNRLCRGVSAIIRETPGLAVENMPSFSFPSDYEPGRITPMDTDFSMVRVNYQPPPPPLPPVAKTSPMAMSTVVVQVTIDQNGIPEMAEAKDGPDHVKMAAVQFVMRWRFAPQFEQGNPVPAQFKLNVLFRVGR